MSQYWKNREAEALKQNKLTEKQYKAEVEKIYNCMLRDIQNEIDAFYGRYAAKEGIKGLIQGKGARELARSLRTLCGASQRNAERLMITELARVQIEAQKLSYKENDFEEYEYIAEPTACPICKVLDGKHFKVAKMLPGENAAPMYPHCRCSTAPYSDRKEFDEWLNYLENGGTTEQWYRRIKISSPGSSKSFQTSLKSIMEGKAGLDKRRKL